MSGRTVGTDLILIRLGMVFRWLYHYVRFTIEMYYYVFFYNEFTTFSNAIDTIFEPVYWLAEKFAQRAGRIFVGLVTLLTTSIVIVYYIYIAPYKAEKHGFEWAVFDLLLGHWLLVNIVFHYYMGVKTSPGYPPRRVDNSVSVCKSCIAPKPPRTHHCGMCRSCILKMDHHCPWLNNCVGHYNHRYFFLFCVYMCSGTIFVCITAYQQFVEYFYAGKHQPSLIGSLISPVYFLFSMHRSSVEEETTMNYMDTTAVADLLEIKPDERFWVLYEFLLCAGVTVALTILITWHGLLISKGQTSIEKHINKKEAERCAELGTVYRNPYHFGLIENWKLFLGIQQGSGRTWRHVLLPSAHKPEGDGTVWRMYQHKSK